MKEESENLLTGAKSQEMAMVIEMIKPYFHLFDVEYAKQVVIAMQNQASWQDSASVINPSYDFSKSQLIRKQAESLRFFIKFIEGLKECDEMKNKIALSEAGKEHISKMFL